MKHLKLLALVTLLIVGVMLIVSCGETTTTAETTTTVPVTTAPPPTVLTALSIAGNDIKDYKIVYAKSPYEAQATNAATSQYFPVYDFDKETADRLAKLIFDLSGISLTVVKDTDTEISDKEILVGNTNRTEVNAVLKPNVIKTDKYAIRTIGTSLVICGGEYGTTWHAIDYLEKLFKDTLADYKTEIAFDNDYTYEGTHHLIQIGCIGDSITAGVGASNGNFNYVSQLGRYLWKDAMVQNYGNSGKTMRNDLNDAYNKTAEYKRALTLAPRTDIFTVMLGTNDSNRDRQWNSNSTEQYNESCMLLFEALKAKNKKLNFVLANCPAYFGGDGFGSTLVRSLQQKLVPTLNDAGYPTTHFDMHNVTKNLSRCFPDSLHPNDEGHMIMAEAFAEHLQEIINSLQK